MQVATRWRHAALPPPFALHVNRVSNVSRLHTPRTRICQAAVTRLNPVRHATLEAGEGKTGHIQTTPNEGILFFDNVFPLRLQWLHRVPWQYGEKEIEKRLNSPGIAGADPLKVIQSAKLPGDAIKVSEILPRLKEGGAFVKFTHAESTSTSDIEASLRKYLKERKVKPWFNPFQRMRARLVLGKPWVEDLYRMPSSRVKVEFLPASEDGSAAELSQEQLYALFRPYGKLADITPQPPDSKILPKFAHLEFAAVRRATMAKNCMHGYKVGDAEGGGKLGTILRLGYEKRQKAHWIRDWLFNHPRIVIPALAALVAGITVAVFDPLRTFFIKAHITRSFHFTDNRLYKWFRAQAADILSLRRRQVDDAGLQAVWDDRKENIDQIRTWLMETADTFIIVQGPRGSGKREMVVDQTLKNRKNTLIIDCKPIQEARGDSPTISAAARQVGYRPIFSWMNNISGWIDLAAQGTTGVKTGFSETLDSQLTKIWNNTATALKQIALEGRHKNDKDAHLSDDEFLEAHPERRPVVVIDSFLHKSNESSIVYDKISEWAAGLTTANIAHVVFLTNDVSFPKPLSKALPDRVFRQISLSDCSPAVAKRFVITHIDSEVDDKDADGINDNTGEKRLTPSQRREDLAELDECISYLGGRLTDLEFLARRIKTGETPNKAVRQIIEQSASEILKMYLFGVESSSSSSSDSSTRRWTPQQAWLLIRQLAQSDTLRYNEAVLDDAFKPHGDATLQALEQAELISILSSAGRPYAIKAGKPVYQPAFQLLTEDRVLRARLDLAILTETIKAANADVDKYERELQMLADLPKQPQELVPRVKWLLGKISKAQESVEKCEAESGELKKVLSSEY